MANAEELRSLLQLLVHRASHVNLLKLAEAAVTFQITAEDPEVYKKALHTLRELVKPSKGMVTVRLLQTSGELASEMWIDNNLTVAGLLREFVSGQGKGELPPSRLRLLLNGQILPSHAVLRDLEFSHDNSLQLVRLSPDSIEISKGSEPYNRQLKLMFIGDAEAGMFEFIGRYSEVDNPFRQTYINHTGGTEFHLRVLVNGNLNVKLMIWDITDQIGFRIHSYGTNGFAMFFSLTSRSSFQNLPNLLQMLQNEFQDHPKILIGTKVDLAKDREVAEEEDIGVKDATDSLISFCLNN
jgi:hypothetical protein